MTADPEIVLVIAADSVGGAEKRLAEIWVQLADRLSNLRMIVRRETFEQLAARPDLTNLVRHVDRVTFVEAKSPRYPATMAAFLSALLRIPPGSVVHHILQAPPFLHRLLGHKLLLSWVGTTFPKPASQLSDWVVSSFSARSADRIDVLNPDIFAFLRRSPRLSPKLSLTAGGTFVDFNHFRPAKSKRNDVVFLGSLVRRRGIVRFVAALPTIAERLAQSGLVARFVILGKRGDAADEVDRLLAGDDYRKLDIHVGKTSNPAAALSEAKVFVALQAVSNYPSKALAEAMACGCVPVITDVGESRLMADDTSAVFIGGDYVPDDLANAISGLLTLNREEFTRRSERVRKAALHRFSIDVQSDYFASLYEGMIGQSGGLRS